ncbi:MAG: hypothetical protein GX754_01430 [Clostridiaceae bacterium]|nr:hypothetical protein [Clostridiaceae bacterium]
MERKTRYTKRMQELMNTENLYIDEIMYKLIPKAYNYGYVSLDKIENDVIQLGLSMDIITTEFLEIDDSEDEDEDEDEVDNDLRENLLKD